MGGKYMWKSKRRCMCWTSTENLYTLKRYSEEEIWNVSKNTSNRVGHEWNSVLHREESGVLMAGAVTFMGSEWVGKVRKEAWPSAAAGPECHKKSRHFFNIRMTYLNLIFRKLKLDSIYKVDYRREETKMRRDTECQTCSGEHSKWVLTTMGRK